MVDSRLPSRWLTDLRFEALSDRAFRTFCGSLMWSNEQGTDGRLPPGAMKFLHPYGVDDKTRRELVKAELWEVAKDGTVTVPGWASAIGQSTAESIERSRELDRERKRRDRAKKAAALQQGVTPDVRADETPESLGEERQGEERQGQDYGEAENGVIDELTGEVVSSWPARQPGSGEWVDPGTCEVCGRPLPCTKRDAKHEAARAA